MRRAAAPASAIRIHVAQCLPVCYIVGVMKTYIHARLSQEDRAVLENLKKSTGQTESEIVRRGLHLVSKELGRTRSARDLAGRSVGKFKKGPADLAANPKHLNGFGE